MVAVAVAVFLRFPVCCGIFFDALGLLGG